MESFIKKSKLLSDFSYQKPYFSKAFQASVKKTQISSKSPAPKSSLISLSSRKHTTNTSSKWKWIWKRSGKGKDLQIQIRGWKVEEMEEIQVLDFKTGDRNFSLFK